MNDRRDKPNVRRALSHVGGQVHIEGDAALGSQLAAALDVPTSEVAEEAARAHVHGFHSYPARMHPLTARRIIESFSRAGDVVLDPFCGSGTVLVEARLAGRRALGVDANPLAVRLASRKLREASEDERSALVEMARAAAAHADERRRAKAGPTKRYGKDDLELFDRHVLLELDGLRAGIDRTPSPLRADLELVLSSMLTKLSRRTSDTSNRELPRRIAAGFAARLFVRKTEELAKRLGEVAPTLAKAPEARVLEGDARVLAGIADHAVNLVVTSPPYPGVYDYLAHHEARLRWLGLRADRFASNEIGARRKLDTLGPIEGVVRWEREIGAALVAMDRVLVKSAFAVLLLADSVIAGKPIYAVDSIRRVLSNTHLRFGAVASQERPHFHEPTRRVFAARPRQEHAILLVRG
ncbi:MAG: site-specific DNA-methyltransferase [Polyangiaceae bacterium]|nr:site-specific DNA-methyltransferase [Polyangiaceae bacterium]